jgi:hypothetical protein
VSRIFGNISQLGYVVRDIQAAMDRWIQHGVGPWFYIESVMPEHFRYRGTDSDLKMSVALANSGDLQLELIQQRNDAPSMYKDFLDSGREGAQHVAYWTTDYQALYDRALTAGYTVGQEGDIGGRFAYLDTEHEQGTVIEISDISGPKGHLFAYIREVAAEWDGAEPIRVLG